MGLCMRTEYHPFSLHAQCFNIGQHQNFSFDICNKLTNPIIGFFNKDGSHVLMRFIIRVRQISGYYI